MIMRLFSPSIFIFVAIAILQPRPALAGAVDGGLLGMQSFMFFLVVLLIVVPVLLGVYIHTRRNTGEERAWERISARLYRREQEAERLRNELYACEDMFALALVGVFRVTADGQQMLYANETLARMLDYPSAAALEEQYHPEVGLFDAENHNFAKNELKEKGSIDAVSLRIPTRKGRILDVIVSARFSDDGQNINGVVMDITSQVQVKQELGTSSRFLRALISATPSPIFFKDAKGVFQLVNSAYEEIVGLPADRIIGKTVWDVYPEEFAAKYERDDAELLAAKGQVSFRYEARVYTISRGYRDAIISKEVLRGEDGVPLGLVGVFVDITEQKTAIRRLKEKEAFLSTLIDSVPDKIYYKDKDLRYLGANKAFLDFAGVRSGDLIGKTDYELFGLDEAESFTEHDRRTLDQLTLIPKEERVVLKGGSVLHFETLKNPFYNSRGEVLGVLGISRDITERKSMENALRNAGEVYRTIFENATEGIFTSSVGGKYINVNPTMASLLGYQTPDECITAISDIGKQVYVDPLVREKIVERLRIAGKVQGAEYQLKRADGSLLWVRSSFSGIFDSDGNLERIEGIATDITDARLEAEELVHRATHDTLTGLANRRKMRQELDRMLSQSKRSGEMVAVLFMDLDGFKGVNDTYGHQTGDALLVEVAGRITSRMRESDVAVRMGGDEFAVLLWDVSGVAGIEKYAREIIDVLGQPFDCDDIACAIGVSIGASVHPQHGNDPERLLRLADEALYKVKRKGKNDFLLAEI